MLRTRKFLTLAVFYFVSCISNSPNNIAPYPPSKVIQSIKWHELTYQAGAPGSDLFPTTWASDDKIYTAWGDGTGFDNTETKKSFGVSVINGVPPTINKKDLFYGPNGSNKGKVIDLLSVNGILYGTFNTQDGKFPNVSYRIIISDDMGKNWRFVPWKWPKGTGRFAPRRFLHSGKDYSDAKDSYVYIYGRKQGDLKRFYLARVKKDKITSQNSYEFLENLDQMNNPGWSNSARNIKAIFTDLNIKKYYFSSFCVCYIKGLDRFIAVTSHGDAGQIGIFDSPTPWGPWTTVAYYESWLGMSRGIFLSMNFPGKWISSDGKAMWAVFSVHGNPQPATFHDKFNLMKVTIQLK
jgi:hypothetical protein